MGTWGVGISSNDTFQEVYDSFFEYYNNNIAIDEIISILLKEYKEIINIPEDCNNFWFALAKSLWECKSLNIDIFKKVENIIKSGNDLIIWEELEASREDLKKRKVVLEKFLNSISNEKEKPKKRIKKRLKLIEPIYEKGDCLSFKIENTYFGIIVLEAEKNEFGLNFIALTDIYKKNKPDLNDFLKSNIIFYQGEIVHGKVITRYTNETPIAYWFQANSYKDYQNIYEKIGNVKINKIFDHCFTGSFNVWIPWDVLKVFAEQIFKKCEYKKVKITKWIK